MLSRLNKILRSAQNDKFYINIPMTHRYTLQPYKTQKSRYTCPACDEPKKFTRYIDTETGDHLADHVGRCDREESCGYHFSPKQFFAQNPESKPTQTYRIMKPPVLERPDYIPKKLFKKSLKHYEKNDFVEFLYNLFDAERVDELIDSYYIGTAKHWPHATIFWQVDRKDNVRTGKIMLYDPYTGKRIKEPYAHITWVHTLIKKEKAQTQKGPHFIGENPSFQSILQTAAAKQQDQSEIENPKSEFNLKQCFFGEHLIYPGGKEVIAIVESEKTAVIAKGFMPEYIWVAAGSLEGLTPDKCRVLHGRQVMLVPDIDGYAKWEKKAQQLKAKMPDTRFGIAQFLQNIPAEHQTPGMDIADWLIAEHVLSLVHASDEG